MVVPGLTPLIRSLLPRPADSNSKASATRELPPVKTTMPSALRSSTTSSLGNSKRKPKKPTPSATSVSKTSLLNSDPICRLLTAPLKLCMAARVPRAQWCYDPTASLRRRGSAATGRNSNFSVDRLKRAVDSAARRARRYQRHEYDLQQNRQIPGDADGKTTE